MTKCNRLLRFSVVALHSFFVIFFTFYFSFVAVAQWFVIINSPSYHLHRGWLKVFFPCSLKTKPKRRKHEKKKYNVLLRVCFFVFNVSPQIRRSIDCNYYDLELCECILRKRWFLFRSHNFSSRLVCVFRGGYFRLVLCLVSFYPRSTSVYRQKIGIV